MLTLKERLSVLIRGAPLPIPRKGGGLIALTIPNPEIDLQPIKTRQQKLEAFAGWVYAATTTIMTDVGQEAWKLVRRTGDRPEDVDPIDDSQIPGHFKRPNDFLTFQDAIELTTLHLDLAGEAFWHIITAGPESEDAVGFEIVYPHWVEDPIVERGRLVGWRVSIPGVAEGHRQIAARDMIFFRYPHPREPLCGASPVEAFALSFELDMQSRGYGAGLLKNNAIPPVVISTEQDLADKDADFISERWKDRHLQRPGEPAVIGKGSKVQLLGLTLQQIGLDVIDKMTRQQVFGTYGVPEFLKGIVEDVNRATAQASTRVYQRNVIKPRLLRIAKGVNGFLIPRIPEVQDLVFKFDNPVQEDLEFQLEKVDKLMERGMITVNQGLLMLGEDEQPDGDVFLVPANVERIPAGLLATAPPPDARTPPTDRGTHIFGDPLLEITELRFLLRQEKLERQLIAKIRQLFSKQQRLVVEAFNQNSDDLLGRSGVKAQVKIEPEPGETGKARTLWIPTSTRDTVDDAILSDQEEWLVILAAAALAAAETGRALFVEMVPEAVPFALVRGEAVKFAERTAATQWANISATTQARVQRLIALGIESGATPTQIAAQIRKGYDEFKGARAATIARTETANALNFGLQQTAKETARREGIELVKVWVTILDGNQRDSHNRANGQTRPIDEQFIVGGSFGQRPHDPALPAAETVNCRCTLAYRKVKRRR
jgi:phage portal protein BeeE